MQRLDGIEHERDARLHVEHAGPVKASVGDAARHVRKRAERVYGIEVPEKEYRLDLLAPREIDLQTVPEVFGAVQASASTQGLERSCKKRTHAVNGRLVVTRRFDFNELADRLHQRFLTALEIEQAFVRNGIRLRLRKGCCFLAWHGQLLSARSAAISSGTSRTV